VLLNRKTHKYAKIRSFCNLHTLSIIRDTEEEELGKIYSMHRYIINVFKILVENVEDKRPLQRPKYRWKDNNKLMLYIVKATNSIAK
jgi:hypothetical protein